MSLLDTIDAMRKQPKHVRSGYAFWVAVSCTLVVLLLWVTTIPARITFLTSLGGAETEAPVAAAPRAEEVSESGRWSRLTSIFGKAFGRDAETEVAAAAAATLPGVTMPDLSNLQQHEAAVAATSLPNVWTEQVSAAKKTDAATARPILIATSSTAVATTSSSTNMLQ